MDQRNLSTDSNRDSHRLRVIDSPPSSGSGLKERAGRFAHDSGRHRRAAAYVRVSTTSRSKLGNVTAFDQNPDVQEQPLRELAAQRGWQIMEVYSDRASGSKEQRPGLGKLMTDARRGLIDVVIVWRFDRFARSVKQLVTALEEFRELGIDFVSHQEALDTSTPMGKAMFTIIGAMAELERGIIRERVAAGLEYARTHGSKSGKAVGRPKVIFRRDLVVELRQQGLSWSDIARQAKVGITTVRRAFSEHTHASGSGNSQGGKR
jgi:DNA invertase Pin-like site-specific DNA recombinase